MRLDKVIISNNIAQANIYSIQDEEYPEDSLLKYKDLILSSFPDEDLSQALNICVPNTSATIMENKFETHAQVDRQVLYPSINWYTGKAKEFIYKLIKCFDTSGSNEIIYRLIWKDAESRVDAPHGWKVCYVGYDFDLTGSPINNYIVGFSPEKRNVMSSLGLANKPVSANNVINPDDVIEVHYDSNDLSFFNSFLIAGVRTNSSSQTESYYSESTKGISNLAESALKDYDYTEDGIPKEIGMIKSPPNIIYK